MLETKRMEPTNLETETLGIGAADISTIKRIEIPIEDRPVYRDAENRHLSYDDLLKVRRYIFS